MSLLDAPHQPYAHRQLQRAMAGGRIPHAYIFHGPEGVGREAFARGLVEILLCPEPTTRDLSPAEQAVFGVPSLPLGCGLCTDCGALRSEAHPDLHVIHRLLSREHPDPEVRRRKALEIGVDVLRHFVIERVGLKPIRGRAKAFVIREADRITPQAQNALLKTLEEPPGTTYLILLATALDRLLPTTLSRCQVVRFDRLPTAFIEERLAVLRPTAAAEARTWCARAADGSLGRALICVDDEVMEHNGRLLKAGFAGGSIRSSEAGETWSAVAEALGAGFRQRDPEITDTEAVRRGWKMLFYLASLWLADVLRVSGGNEAMLVNRDERTALVAAAEGLGAERAAAAIERIARAEHQLDLNANTQLVIDTLLAALGRLTAVERIHAR